MPGLLRKASDISVEIPAEEENGRALPPQLVRKGKAAGHVAGAQDRRRICSDNDAMGHPSEESGGVRPDVHVPHGNPMGG